MSVPLVCPRFVKQCEMFLLHDHISCELFACECLPTLLQLARDKVPNVRIAIAKLLKDSVMSSGQWWVGGGDGGVVGHGGRSFC